MDRRIKVCRDPEVDLIVEVDSEAVASEEVAEDFVRVRFTVVFSDRDFMAGDVSEDCSPR